MSYKITALKKAIEQLGIQLSVDQIRKLELAGIVLCTHSSKSKHREFTEEQFKKSLRNLLLYYFNTPIKDILSDNPDTIKNRIKKIKQALKLIA